MGPTGNAYRVVQIHPTRRCNLRCRHCYSSSGPDESDMLEPTDLLHAITDAAVEGYNVVGFSGGEPLLYPALADLLAHARQCGMYTTVTTNGMLLTRRRLKALREVTNLIAISVDGIPQSHNWMRASDRAFDVMASRLPAIRDAGIPFGFIFTLTQFNLDELDWVLEFALSQGARLLQIHPLESVGRARETLTHALPDWVELGYAVIAVARAQALAGDRLRVQLDVAPRDLLIAEPERVFASEALPADAQLAEMVSPLIVEPDGFVVPVEYSFGHDYAIGNLAEARLARLAVEWKRERYPKFLDLCRSTFKEVTHCSQPPVMNWYGQVTSRGATTLSA